MAWSDDADQIWKDVACLRALVDEHPELSAEARVTALSSMLSAEAAAVAVETFQANKDGVEHDVIRPLTAALAKFPEAASKLAAELHRLPGR